jgi:hypothetical protein
MRPEVTDLEVTPGMLAEQKGWSRQKAWREMQRIEREHPGTLRREGRRVFALASELGPLIRGLEPSPLERAVQQCRQGLSELTRRFDAGMADVLSRLRKVEQRDRTGK